MVMVDSRSRVGSYFRLRNYVHVHSPCIVEYIGYGGGRGFPFDWLVWASAGFAHFVIDTRGQGSTWRQGDTPDIPPEGSNSHYPGFMTDGILQPKTYYYRRVFTDAVRAVQAARTRHAIDPHRIIITGTSQGGGIAIYNHYAGPKQIRVWQYNQHDGGGTYQTIEKLKALHEQGI